MMMMEQTEQSLHFRGEVKLCLVLLCGLPGAGKTSLAESIRQTGSLGVNPTATPTVGETAGDTFPTVCHLCYDDIIPRQLEMEMIRQDSAPTEQSVGIVLSESSPDFLMFESLDGTTWGGGDIFRAVPGVASLPASVLTPWKAYRREIVHCMDVILERLKSSEVANKATILDDVKGLLGNQELSQIGREVWSKILSQFQDQLTVGGSEQHKPLPMSSRQGRPVLPTPSVVLVIDDNLYYRSMRYEYYQLARKYGTGFCQLYLHCDTEEAIARNSERCHGVPKETITKMAHRIEPPDQQIAPWEKHCIRMNVEEVANERTMSAVWELISKALLDPVSPLEVENTEEKEACRAVSAASVIHQADQSLRKCVAKAMAAAKDEGSLTKAELKTLGARLNTIRQDMLQGIRDCKVCPPPLVAMETDHSNGTEQCSDFDRFIQEFFDQAQQGR